MESVDYKELAKQLLDVLEQARDHLNYCGYGDSWERECAGDLDQQIEITIASAHSLLTDPKVVK